ncbi:MAG: adenosylcobinamide-phosphate synthase CbiB [Clostridiaceae bacterium]
MMNLVFSFMLDAVIGDPYSFPHPVKYIGKYISNFEYRVRGIKPDKKQLKHLYGPLLWFTAVIMAYVITDMVLKLSAMVSIYLYHIVNIVLLWTTIAPKCLSKEGAKIYKPLKEGNLELARERVSYLVSRDTKDMDRDDICRAAIETILENTSDGVIAPMFFAAVGGAPLAMAYKAVNTLDSMVGYKNEKYMDFGFFSAKADDLFNLVPARLSGILIIISSFILGYDYKGAARIFLRDRKNHKSPNSAHPEAAGAGALGIRLGGPTSYFGKISEKPYIGDKKRDTEPEDILKSIKLLYVSAVLFLVFYIIIK